MRFISFLILIVVAFMGFSFALLNAQMVSIDYYIGTREFPLSILLVIAFVIGIFFGMILFLPSHLRLKFENRKLRHKEG